MTKRELMKKNIFWNMIGSFTLSITSLFYSIILTRYCNLEDAGIFAFGFSFACMMVTLASFGGRTYQVTDHSGKINTISYIITRYLTVNIAFLLIMIYLVVKDYNLLKTISIIFLCVFKFLEEISDVYYAILQKANKLYVVGKCQFIKSLINIIGFSIIILLTKKILFAILFITLINLIFTFVIERPFAKKEDNWEFSFKYNEIIHILKSNFLICSYTFLSSCIISAPKYAIDEYLTNEMQAIFNPIVMPATIMFVISGFIVTPLLVNISLLFKEKQINDIKKILRKMIYIVAGSGLITILGAYILGIPVLNIIYNLRLNKYKLDLIFIIVGAIFYTISSIIGTVLITMREIVPQLFITILNTLFAFIISYYLVYKYGIHGGSVGYLLTMVFRILTYFILSKFTFLKYEVKD